MARRLLSADKIGPTLPDDRMTDAGLAGRNPEDRKLELRVAARLENLAVLRTLVGAVGTTEDLDADTVADLRLAVDEMCTRLIHAAGPHATLLMVVEPYDYELVVVASTLCDTYEVVPPGSFSWHILTSLSDDVQTFHDGDELGRPGGLFGVKLTMPRVGAAR